ncbi:hypothetical protein D2W70_01550 [Burkholderia pseudomallei]|nr:hypothetical protein D2W49_32135 [Burkholderia pseudomallei]RIV56973.1 hypothetical protein D2W70_01550 [Burkholderia pseudomallei]
MTSNIKNQLIRNAFIRKRNLMVCVLNFDCVRLFSGMREAVIRHFVFMRGSADRQA